MGTGSAGRKRAAAGEAWGPLAKIVAYNYEERRPWKNNSYSLEITLKSDPKREDLIRNLHEVQGVFKAYTLSYYTVSRITNEKGRNVVAGDGNERQFRMKLPDTPICALLAVGCRYYILIITITKVLKNYSH